VCTVEYIKGLPHLIAFSTSCGSARLSSLSKYSWRQSFKRRRRRVLLRRCSGAVRPAAAHLWNSSLRGMSAHATRAHKVWSDG
jgi:hypothetical protein